MLKQFFLERLYDLYWLLKFKFIFLLVGSEGGRITK